MIKNRNPRTKANRKRDVYSLKTYVKITKLKKFAIKQNIF